MPQSATSSALSPPPPTEEWDRLDRELEQSTGTHQQQTLTADISSNTLQKQVRPTTSFVWKNKDTGIVNGRKVTIDGADMWECAHCKNRTQPQRYKVTSGTTPCTIHLKEKHGIVETSSRKRQRLEQSQMNLHTAMQ
ncbi:hypothetical protein BDD12DRAFT_803355 [Trichophaea hybrida]|nr:hypothetical protein BDD12DRAFT_803355 [Trichophaea hybrida]